MKKYIPLIFPLLAILACNAAISDVFGEPPSDNDFLSQEGYEKQLTMTLFAVDTLIAEATATSVAETQAAQANSPDLEKFCEIYNEYVDDINARIDEYERVVGGGGDGDPLALSADQAVEEYMDRLVGPAPAEIRPAMEALANMSLIGLFSSQASISAATPLLEDVDAYAADNCGISFNQ